MKKQAFNPYLPLWEYIPDGEPRVFGDRIYIYGSHDEAGGTTYCLNDYVVWSAPVSDPADWRCEGVSYRKDQDPSNRDGRKQLFAPDVVRGTDGRYYLYYNIAVIPELGIAVSESPAGPFEFYGHLKYPDDVRGGGDVHAFNPFDPAVFVDDDGRVYLCFGFCSPKDVPIPTREELIANGTPEDEADALLREMTPPDDLLPITGCMTVELEPDMMTMKGEPKMMIPGGKLAPGTPYEGHGFYEASSLRKINGRYYFVYSSQVSHELCYAVSDRPNEGYVYGGVIVSSGDIGYHGNTHPVSMMGNVHGGIAKIGQDYYIFYHRQTHGTEYSRQGCAERIDILPDGSIPQVEITSCGLNRGPLRAKGCYPAAIACRLTCPDNRWALGADHDGKALPYIFEERAQDNASESIHYIANVFDRVSFGYKYFEFQDAACVKLTVRGDANGVFRMMLDDPKANPVAQAKIRPCGDWQTICFTLPETSGAHALFFEYSGAGACQVKDLIFE